MGSWKCVKNGIAKYKKFLNEVPNNTIYHFVMLPIKVLWKICNLMISSINELDEHHKWKFMTCMEGSSPRFLSNLGMSDGNFMGITDYLS